jgi:SAM-dependent methyltransferase
MAKTSQSRMKYAKDELGKEILLKDNNLQVMMEWEKPYMEACIDALKPTGDVLEIGFGLGYSAQHIQKYKPKSHTIIECDPLVLEKAHEFAKKHPNVKIISAMWQDILDQLDQYDAIFFDDYSPFSEADVKEMQQESQNYKKMAKEAQTLKESLQKTLKQFEDVKFSDAEILDFVKNILKKPNISAEKVAEFLNNMVSLHHITEKQKNSAMKELIKEAKKQGETPDNPTLSWINRKELTGDRFISFAEECLDKHMKKGSKLSAYMGSSETKLKSKDFQDKILSRKDVHYSEETMPIEVPKNCKYYDSKEALIIIIEKK